MTDILTGFLIIFDGILLTLSIMLFIIIIKILEGEILE